MKTNEIAKLFEAKVPEFRAAFGPCFSVTKQRDSAVSTVVTCKQIRNDKILSVVMSAKTGSPDGLVKSVMNNAFSTMRRELESLI